MKRCSLVPVVVLALIGAVGSAHTEESKENPFTAGAAAQEEQPEPAWPSGYLPFEVTGRFDLGFRAVDVKGSEDKYREDVNLKTGPRVFNLDLNVNPGDDRFFDIMNVTATNLGGDPFEFTSLTVENYEKFKFQFLHRKSAYFYRDTIVPIEASDPSLANAGDFHTFSLDRSNDGFGANVKLTPRTHVFVDFNHQTRGGESTTTLDLSRDEFELDKPLDETKDDYRAGVQAAWNKVSVYYDFSYRDYENDWRIFLPGASSGEDREDPAELFFYDQLTPYDFTSPQSTFKLNLRPDPRWTVNFGFIYNTLESEIRFEETLRGLSYTGAPIDSFVEGEGKIDRTMKLADLDVSFEATERISIIGGARFHRLDQEALWEGAPEEVETGVDISTDIYEIGVQTFPNLQFTVTAGIRFEDREVLAIHEGEPDEEPNTQRTTFFLNGVYGPSAKVNLLAEYERGDYDNPFTDMSPTSQDRVKVRLRSSPNQDLSIVGTYWYRKNTNSLSGGVFDLASFAAQVSYDVDSAVVFGSYSYQKNTNDIDTEKKTLPGFGGGQVFFFPVFYESKINMGRGGLRYAFIDAVTAGLEFVTYDNRGSFPLKWNRFDVYTELSFPAGYLLRLLYQRYDYDEDAFNFDDYDANIFMASVGYSF